MLPTGRLVKSRIDTCKEPRLHGYIPDGKSSTGLQFILCISVSVIVLIGEGVSPTSLTQPVQQYHAASATQQLILSTPASSTDQTNATSPAVAQGTDYSTFLSRHRPAFGSAGQQQQLETTSTAQACYSSAGTAVPQAAAASHFYQSAYQDQAARTSFLPFAGYSYDYYNGRH